ncbi:MAG: virB8 [Gammaproteobacteria bacterium]|jgi:type IV secretion system protein VirB8|nr:virB8 [Gammaproteobacteria bacterium]
MPFNQLKEKTKAAKAIIKERLSQEVFKTEGNYYREAKHWYEEVYESVLCSRDRYRLLSVILGGLLTLSLIALVLLIPLKKVVYRVLTLNQTTGEVVQLKELEGSHFSENWIMTRYFISQYIQAKNTYHYTDIKRLFNATLAMSAPIIAKNVEAEMVDTNPESPINQLGKEGYQDVIVLSINQLNANTALARFRILTHPKDDPTHVKSADFQVVMKWDYQNTKSSLEERDLNPLGFKVTYYQASPLFTDN